MNYELRCRFWSDSKIKKFPGVRQKKSGNHARTYFTMMKCHVELLKKSVVKIFKRMKVLLESEMKLDMIS